MKKMSAGPCTMGSDLTEANNVCMELTAIPCMCRTLSNLIALCV